MKWRSPKVLLHFKESETEEKKKNQKQEEIMCTLYGGRKIAPVKIFMEGISKGKKLEFGLSSI